MAAKEYDVYSDFNLELHKKTFINYLEVIIDENGTIMYAFPSHQQKLIALACSKLNVTLNELQNMCPREYYGDYMFWLCKITNAVSVWEHTYIANKLNKNHLAALRKLKMGGVYKGPIPLSPAKHCS